ncbi:MAG: polyhydroxyalkanoate synthesis repressor PhaR, partial [Asticcacaulis sp.]|nr:polyhydroxyalkanoate synthesis repressor PhaR [Asticcacaulis sp.]
GAAAPAAPAPRETDTVRELREQMEAMKAQIDALAKKA